MQGTSIGSYRVLSELGSGGMGTVYLAEAEVRVGTIEPGTRVALKVIHPHLLGRRGFFKRFLQEARVGRRVRHENVVSTMDVDAAEIDGKLSLFLAMEHVSGETLRTLLGRFGRVPEVLVRELARQIAAGLAAIHEAGIVHRDLKPENVLVTRDHEVRIMDLGVARLLEDSGSLTEDGHFAGSLLYAAPEQFGGEEIGTAADLYAVGTLLYELCTGANPFRYDDAGSVIRAHLETVPPPVTERNPEVSPFLSELIGTLLAKNPADRVASAALLRDLIAHGEASTWWSERRDQILAARLRRPRVPVHRETVLCGRDRELTTLAEAWAAACEGRGNSVLVEGEAGIGKTRLVDAFLEEIGEADAHVLYGAYPPSGGMGGLSAAILDHFGAAHLEGSLAPYLPHAASLAPSFAAVVKHVTPPPGAEPLVGDALHALNVYVMRGLAAEKPLVWVVDDLHFAGPDSRKVALSMARAVEGHRVLLLLTARPGLPGDELAHFSRLDTCRRMTLERLSPREVIELLRDAFRSTALAERLGGKIAYKSDGVPFFVFEMIRGLKEGQFISQQADGSFVTTRVVDEIEVPSAVRGLVEGRLSHLTPGDRAILDVAAVQGNEFDGTLVAHVLEMKTIPVLQRLAEMERRSGIVRASGRRSRFDHHQVQEVVYDALPEALRAEYHAALAEACAAREGVAPGGASDVRGETAVFLATHHLRGTRPKQARPFLEAALDHLETSWRNEALVDVAGAALAEEGMLTGAARVGILSRRAERLGFLGRSDEEGADLDEALSIATTLGDPDLSCGVKTRIGWRLIRLSSYADATKASSEAVELARQAGSKRLESTATEHLGICAHYTARYKEARELFERAVALGEEAGHPPAVARATGGLGVVMRTLGDYAAAQRLHERHLEMARDLGDRRGMMNALGNLANIHNYQRRYDQARPVYDQALTLAREIGDRFGEAALIGSRSGIEWMCGEIASALELYETTLHLDREIGNREGEVRALMNLGQAWRVFGRHERSQRHYDAALDLSAQTHARLLEAYALAGKGLTTRETGRLQEARRQLERGLGIFREIGHKEGIVFGLECAGWVLTDLGAHEEARRGLREALQLLGEGAADGSRASLLCRLALLPGGDVAAAVAAAESTRREGSLFGQMELAFLVWRATGDEAQLARARELLEDLAARAPAEHRDSMVQNVMLHRAIRSDWEASRGS